MRGSGFRSKEERIVLWGGGIVLAILIGLGLLWLGYALGQSGVGVTSTATATPTATLQPPPTADIVVVVPTATSLPPTATSLPTEVPATDTPVVAMIEAGANGLNIRSGPGTNFSRLAHADPGTTFVVTGRYADWWQIDYNGTAAWAYSGVVTATNTDNVPEVVPPASPVPPPPTNTPVPTAVPATPVPVATSPPDTRGLRVNKFTIDNAPGPYGNAGDIWFNLDITNTTGNQMVITKLGAWVEENGQFKVSWGVADPLKIGAGNTFTWRDHLRSENMPAVGTYHVWLRACFQDGACINIAGPIEVKIG